MLPDIVGYPSKCHYMESCTTMLCCTDVPYLKLTLQTRLTIDPCGYTVNVAINSLQKTISLINYERGVFTVYRKLYPCLVMKEVCLQSTENYISV